MQCLQLSFVSEPWDVPAGCTEDLDRTLQSPKQLKTDTIPWPALHINIDTVSVVLVLEKKDLLMFEIAQMTIIALKALYFLVAKAKVSPFPYFTVHRQKKSYCQRKASLLLQLAYRISAKVIFSE